MVLGTKSIEKFLENVADNEEAILSREMAAKGLDEGIIFGDLGPPQNERPHGGVNDEIHGHADQFDNPSPCEIQRTQKLEGSFVGLAAG